MKQIAMLSYGKDSLAQLEVMHRNGLPFTDIVTADIWATPDVPAYLPELVDFRERIDREIFERYGVPVTHVRAEKTFIDYFYRELTERSKYTGTWGWPPMFGHWCTKYLKLHPIRDYFEGLDFVEWVGIAADEPARHGQLNERKRSALVEFGITEYWQMMMDWDKDTEKRFKINHTLPEYDRRFRLEKEGRVPIGRRFKWCMIEEPEKQLSLFDLEERKEAET